MENQHSEAPYKDLQELRTDVFRLAQKAVDEGGSLITYISITSPYVCMYDWDDDEHCRAAIIVTFGLCGETVAEILINHWTETLPLPPGLKISFDDPLAYWILPLDDEGGELEDYDYNKGREMMLESLAKLEEDDYIDNVSLDYMENCNEISFRIRETKNAHGDGNRIESDKFIQIFAPELKPFMPSPSLLNEYVYYQSWFSIGGDIGGDFGGDLECDLMIRWILPVINHDTSISYKKLVRTLGKEGGLKDIDLDNRWKWTNKIEDVPAKQR